MSHVFWSPDSGFFLIWLFNRPRKNRFGYWSDFCLVVRITIYGKMRPHRALLQMMPTMFCLSLVCLSGAYTALNCSLCALVVRFQRTRIHPNRVRIDGDMNILLFSRESILLEIRSHAFRWCMCRFISQIVHIDCAIKISPRSAQSDENWLRYLWFTFCLQCFCYFTCYLSYYCWCTTKYMFLVTMGQFINYQRTIEYTIYTALELNGLVTSL